MRLGAILLVLVSGIALGKPVKHATKGKAKAGAAVATTKGKKGKVARVRKPPAPSYQTHPDPERYQQIQQALTDRGYYKGPVNGTWDADSAQALQKFQADQKLEADGKITALTLRGLGLGPKHDGSTAPLSGAKAVVAPVDAPPQPAELPADSPVPAPE